MKILHIHTSFNSGGIEAMICGLANEMVKTENVSVCSIFKPKENDVFWNKLSSNVCKLSVGKLKPGFSITEIFKIYKLINRGKFDVVNLHGFFYYYIFTVLFLRKRVKFFYTVHSDAIMENSTWDRRLLPIKRLFFKQGWIFPITISEASKASFIKLYGAESKLIYNGVPKPSISQDNLLSVYRISPKTKLFIHAGRISKEKNQLNLCEVFQSLINKGFDIVLIIAGSIQNKEIYNSLKPYFSDRIHYLGERNDVPQLMSNCDAMCLPSIWEGLPITLLEALSVGCIPICSPVGGIPDVITSGKNGFLSSSSSKKDYLATMESFLSLEEGRLRNIKKECVTSFAKFEMSNTANSYLNYYQSKL